MIFWLFLFFFFLFYKCVVYFFVRVPYLGTSKNRAKTIFKHLSVRGKIVYDLGCGRGDFLFAAEKRGAKKLIGVELWPTYCWFAAAKARLLGSKIEFRRENYFDTNITTADVIYLFLIPPAIKKLAPKIRKEAHPGALLASLGSSVPGFLKEKIIPLDHIGRVRLYIYKISDNL